jgi:hypothetical protein
MSLYRRMFKASRRRSKGFGSFFSLRTSSLDHAYIVKSYSISVRVSDHLLVVHVLHKASDVLLLASLVDLLDVFLAERLQVKEGELLLHTIRLRGGAVERNRMCRSAPFVDERRMSGRFAYVTISPPVLALDQS